MRRELWREDVLVDLAPRVFACLCYLVEQRERAVSRAELIAAAWRRDNVSETQLFQLVLRARRAVGDDAEQQRCIRTIVGFGYRWVAPTQVADSSAADAPPATTVPEPAPTATSTPASAAGHAAGMPTKVGAVPARFGRAMRLAAIAIAVALAAGILWYATRTPVAPVTSAGTPAQTAPAQRWAVLPFAVEPVEGLAWVRLGGMDLLADRLGRAGLAVQPAEGTLGLLASAGADAAAQDARLRSEGIDAVVSGVAVRQGTAWTVTLTAALASVPPLRTGATDTDLMTALQQASDRLLTALGRALPDRGLDGVLVGLLQQARTALLEDDAPRARALLDAAPPSLRDDPEAGLLSARVEARLGHFEAAIDQASALLDAASGADDPYLRMRILITRGAARIPLDQAGEARADFDAALAVPGAATFPHTLGEAYLGRGITASMRGDAGGGAADLGRARVLLDQSGDALGVARVDLSWAVLDAGRGAFAEAGPRFERAARSFEAFGARRPLRSALIGLQDIQLDLLDIRAALATNERAWTASAPGNDPLLRRVLTLQRARSLFAVGRLRETRELLDALATGTQDYLALSRDAERLRLLEVELALAEARSDDARRDAAELPTGPLPGGGDDVLRARAALVRERTLHEDGPPTPTPATAGDDAGTRHAGPYRRLAEAERAARRGQGDAADAAYRQALAQADAIGLPVTIAEVVASYVPFLLAAGRTSEAAELAGRVGTWAEEDYGSAVVRLRVAHALGAVPAWQAALDAARRVAGERRLPAGLTAAPAALRP
ncbi:winged helix-turn-helix domain-containing protein [Dokdonella koreensis]|uniref:Transcriptional regulator, CadC family n=1 Tax=Dokdonella koreensis DS-123 TaxID=1300342 RepID=A0A160DYA5_9GAMM|nr:winged helix-turn-helix domain-containing protein [Dokdonella koreensis]ANB19584.1 Transcriptional regulator, CadC family [Dokdonella koreensis DS-123]